MLVGFGGASLIGDFTTVCGVSGAFQGVIRVQSMAGEVVLGRRTKPQASQRDGEMHIGHQVNMADGFGQMQTTHEVRC